MALGAGGGLEAGKAFVDLVPRLSPNFGQETSKLIGSGIKPATGKLTSDLEQAGAAGGTKAGTAASKNLSSSITSGFSGIARNVTGLFVGLGAVRVLGDSLSEAREAVKVGQLTDAVIKSTGASAGVTAEHVGDLANKLSMVAGVDDELIQSGENVLLTFTNVKNAVGDGNNIFDQGTAIALDMSRALGTDLQGSLIQVGKALNDPIQGVGALRRVGVQLSDDQEALVKSLVASGDVLGAQKVILAELTKEFGGAAAAAADPLDKASVAAKNAEEEIGKALLPVMVDLSKVFAEDVAPALTTIVAGFSAMPGPLKSATLLLIGVGVAAGPIGKVAGALGGLGKVIFGIGKGVGAGIGALGKLGAAAGRLSVDVASAAGRVVVSAARMVASFVTMAARGIASFVTMAARAVVSAATTAAAWIASAASAVASFVVMAAAAVVNAAIIVAAWLAAALPFIALGVAVAAVVLLIINNWDTISAVTVEVWNTIVSFLSGVISSIIGFFSALPGAVIGFVSDAFWGAYNAATGALGALVGFVAGIPGAILGALGSLGGLLWDAGVAIIQGLIGGARSMLGSVKDFFVGIKDLIFGWKGPPPVDRLLLIPAGAQIMRGLVDGAASELGHVEDFFANRVPSVIDVNAGVRVNARGRFADVAAYTPAAGLGGGSSPVIVHGPLVGVEALHVRNDDDVVTISRRLDQEKNRALRAAGKQASVLP